MQKSAYDIHLVCGCTGAGKSTYAASPTRDIFVNWAGEQSYSLQLHFVDVPTKIRWQRVQKRNTERAETFQFEVTREMFDFIGSIWEAPSSQEIAELNGVHITD